MDLGICGSSYNQSLADTEGQLCIWGVKSYMRTFPLHRRLALPMPMLFKGQLERLEV